MDWLGKLLVDEFGLRAELGEALRNCAPSELSCSSAVTEGSLATDGCSSGVITWDAYYVFPVILGSCGQRRAKAVRND